MDYKLSKLKVVSSSSIWLSFTLNLIPGLGTGYLYQRRWKAYWLTLISSLGCSSIFLYLNSQVDLNDPVSKSFDNLNLIGLLSICIITAFESALSVRSARKKLKASEN